MTELPDDVMTVLCETAHGAHIQHMAEAKANVTNSSNIIRHAVARLVDEPSPAQARAIDKILRLPKPTS